MEHQHPTYPKARQTGLLIEQVGDDTIIYDEDRKEAHSLNRPASIVWSHSDGTRSVEDLAAVLGSELGAEAPEPVAQYAIDELSRAHLLDAEVSDDSESVSRRDVIKKLSLAGAAAIVLPAVLTIAAPTPAMALSSGQNPQGQNQTGQTQNGQ